MHLFAQRLRHYALLMVLAAALMLSGYSGASAQGKLNSSGPWQIFGTGETTNLQYADALWAANPDGTARTQLVKGQTVVKFAPSPSGHFVAYISADNTDMSQPHNLTLNMLTLPNEASQVITHLTNAQTEPKGDQRDEATEAITDHDSLSWSPDGKWLAFIGAEGSPSADVFVYSMDSHKVSQLTDGPSQVYTLSWSPDSYYIAHFGVDEFGTGAGASMAGGWAAPVDGSPVKTLYKPKGGGENIVGWTGPTTFIAQSWDIMCGWHDLRTYDINTKAQKSLYPGYFNDVAYAPAAGKFLLALGHDMNCTDTSDPSPKAGLYLLVFGQKKPTRLLDSAYFVKWLPTLNEFMAVQAYFGSPVSVTPDGKVTPLSLVLDNVFPVATPDGKQIAWVGDNAALFTAQAPDFASVDLKIGSVTEVNWAR